MGHDHNRKADTGKSAKERPGRGWTERFSGAILYRRYTDLDDGGRPSIFFKFQLAPGQDNLPQAVYDILHELKRLKPRPGHGTTGQPTGLQFNRSKTHGRVWRLPDNDVGRLAADIIDAKLSDLAAELGAEPERER